MSQELLKEVQKGNFPVVGFAYSILRESAFSILIAEKDGKLTANNGCYEAVIKESDLLHPEAITGEELVETIGQVKEYEERRLKVNKNTKGAKVWEYSNIVGDVTFRFVD